MLFKNEKCGPDENPYSDTSRAVFLASKPCATKTINSHLEKFIITFF